MKDVTMEELDYSFFNWYVVLLLVVIFLLYCIWSVSMKEATKYTSGLVRPEEVAKGTKT